MIIMLFKSIHEHPELFQATQGCGCKDAAGTMNHLGVARSIEKIDTLVRMVSAKCDEFTDDEIRAKLLDTLNNYTEPQ